MKKMVVVMGCLLGWGGLLSADTGVAQINGTTANSTISGIVTLVDTPAGLKVLAQLNGVPAGSHGFHIHELGLCTDSGKAAGGHYNPENTEHGMVMKEGVHHAHAGDMGNIVAGADGKATLEVVLPEITLTGGKYPVAGRAIILHEKTDDFGQPVGNAGGRIGCGAIVLSGK